MTNGPKITIITACYNSEKTIEQTIQSVITQKYDNIEYIIVDGASTDHTMRIVEKYSDQIDIIISEQDKGIYDAFNKGANAATGEYIQYLNSDDYLLNDDVISKMSNEIIKYNYPVALYGGILVIDETTGYIRTSNADISFDMFKKGKMLPHPATFMKSEIIKQIQFDTNYKIAADYDLVAKVYSKHPNDVKYSQELVAMFRLGGISSNPFHKKKLNEEVNEILKLNFNQSNETIFLSKNEDYYKMLLKQMIFSKQSLGTTLTNLNIENIAIFGSGEWAYILMKDFSINSIQINCFIDNDEKRHGLILNDIPVVGPDWIKENASKIDAIILGFEGDHDEVVKKQLSEYVELNRKLIISWRELILKL
ncbi:glycosyltransferase [Psychrobacillus sp. L3]|uniref:glycosyltransferase n=1 Tax=Psychrobacillus sp. L3 TaxID=3236891 RepID=UPI0036F3B7F1